MSLVQEFELLRQIPFFAEMEPARLKLLAFMSQRVAYDAGKTLFSQGDAADAAYLIIEGEADILVDTPTGPVTLATLGPQRHRRRDGDPVRRAAHRDGARQDPARRAAHRQGAVSAHGARVSEHGRLDHARAGAPARTDQPAAARRAFRGQASCARHRAAAARQDWNRGRMSRLDSFIRRLEAQRACLDRAAALIRGIDGHRAGARSRQRPHL